MTQCVKHITFTPDHTLQTWSLYSFLFSFFVLLPCMCLCVCLFICVFPEFDMVSRHLYYTRYEYTNPESKRRGSEDRGTAVGFKFLNYKQREKQTNR